MPTFLGIDPGGSGGVALVEKSKQVTLLTSMPDTETDLWELIKEVAECNDPIVGVIEQVGGFIGQGQPGSGMFKFGQNYGLCRMAMIAARIPFNQVTPQKWQKHYSMSRKKGESKTDWKRRLKERAQQLYPGVNITNDTADALLIANYLRETHV